MANINKSWKRLVAVSCSHSVYADPLALEGVLRFRDVFKPHTTVHLGDFIDATAFRSGAKGSSDEAADVEPDVGSGLDFIHLLKPTHIFLGNHEDRLWRLRNHYNAIVSHCATQVCQSINDTGRALGAEIIPYHVKLGWREIGGVQYGHGYFFNQMACRDHAEAFGSCVFGHTHTCGIQYGRRSDNPIAYNAGTLTRIENLDYAKARRQTLAWSQGFVWGEYMETKTRKESQLWLHSVGQNERLEKWRLPI